MLSEERLREIMDPYLYKGSVEDPVAFAAAIEREVLGASAEPSLVTLNPAPHAAVPFVPSPSVKVTIGAPPESAEAVAVAYFHQIARLQQQLAEMEQSKDAAYGERNHCVALIARLALSMGWRAGIARTAIEGWSADWHGCVYIDLPSGQVSWHYHDSQAPLFEWLPAYSSQWDGHDTPEKYRRVDEIANRGVPSNVYSGLVQQLAQAQADAGRLRLALFNLINEAAGMSELARPCVGNTNVACLLRRCDEAQDALAGSPQESDHG